MVAAGRRSNYGVFSSPGNHRFSYLELPLFSSSKFTNAEHCVTINKSWVNFQKQKLYMDQL